MTPPGATATATSDAAGAPLLQDLALPPAAAQEPAWLQQRRTTAQTWLQRNGLPGRHDEAWKYTPLRELAAFAPARANGAASQAAAALAPAALDALVGAADGPRVVLVNGALAPELSDLTALPAGVTLTTEADLVAAPPAAGAFGPFPSAGAAATATRDQSRFDGFQALASLAAPTGVVLTVAPATAVAQPITVVHVAAPGGAALANHLRLLVQVGAGSTLTLAEVFAAAPGDDECYLTNAAADVEVGAEATVQHLKVQLEAPGAAHVSHTAARLATGATFTSVSASLGAEIGRNAVDVTLAGDGASADVRGLYLPTGTQRLDNAVTVEHLASHGTSDQLFKAVANDKGKGSFIGRILVQPGTVGTDANQTSRSLLLARTAEADSRPWLEIFADDVACTHGAAVGRLDAEALFYLRTRGIPEAEARALLIAAFAREIVDAISLPGLQARVEATVAAKITLPGEPTQPAEEPAHAEETP